MERRTPPHLCNNNQNNNTVHGNNAVVLNFDPISNILQQSGTDSKIQRLYKLLNPLESSTRRGINVPKDGCLVGTRRELLQQISSFASDTNPPHTCLILGLAGMGKSALARSIADTLTDSGIVVVSYFISRSIPQSRKVERLVQTLAYQLAKHDAMICERLLATITSDPGLLQYSVNDQVQRLLVSPLISAHSRADSPLVLNIDGLDEAEDVQPLLYELIEPLALALVGFPRRVKLIASSREFSALRMARSRGGLEGLFDEQWLHKINETTVRSDIRTYIADGLGRLAERADLGPAWPSNAQMDALAYRAGSLFIYAATVLQFLEGQPLPKKLLEELLSSDHRLATVASAGGSPFAKLDALYDQVLHTCVGATPLSIESDLIKQLRMVIAGVVYSAEPMSMRMLSSMLGIGLSDLNLIARSLAAIWVVPQEADELLIVHHLSFSEFIGDARRCTEACFCVTPIAAHELLATACLRKMNHGLRRDICDLMKPESCVEPTLKYACFHGVETHLWQCLADKDSEKAPGDALVEQLVQFCDGHLLHWVEVRAVFGEDSLNALIQTLYSWTRFEPNGQVDACARVCRALVELHDMVHEFQTTILASPLEVYNTCLTMLPSGFLVSAYASNLDAMARRITPHPDAWPHVRFLFSQAATTTCNATEGNSTAYGFVKARENLSNGQSYVLLWTAMPTTPARLDMPHADDFALQSMAFSAAAGLLVTLSSGTSGSLNCGSFITVWDLSVLRVISLRRLTTSILGVSFDASGSHVICVTCDLLSPVIRLPNSLDRHIPKLLHSTGWHVPSFSADRTGVVFGKYRESLFWAGESTRWVPIELPNSKWQHSTRFPNSNPLDAHVIICGNSSVVVVKFFATLLDGCMLRAWSMSWPETPRMVQVFTAKSSIMTGPPALSHDGSTLAFHVPDTIVNTFSLIVGQLVWAGQPRFAPLMTWSCVRDMPIQFSKYGSYITGFDRRQGLKVWDVGNGRESGQADGNLGARFRSTPHASSSSARSGFRTQKRMSSLQYNPTWFDSSFSKPSYDISSRHLSFTSTGVVGSENVTGKSHAVLLSSHVYSYRHFEVNRLSRFWYWLAASLVRTQVEFSVLTHEPLELVLKSGIVDQISLNPHIFAFAAGDTLLVVVYQRQIYSIFAGSLPSRKMILDSSVSAAAFSASRKALAVISKYMELILVFTIQPEGIQFHGRYILPSTSSWRLTCMEFDPDGSHLLLSISLQTSRSGYASQDQPETINESIGWLQFKDDGADERVDSPFSAEDEDSVINVLFLAIGGVARSSEDSPTFFKEMSSLGQNLVWYRPLLYLHTIYGGPTVLDFSQHPALQQPAPAEEPPVADPELTIDDQEDYPLFSDDDYDEDDLLYTNSDDE